MKRLAGLLFVMLTLCSGCSRSDVLTPRDFTTEFAASLANANPAVKVAIVKDLELRVTRADGRESTSFLDNAYDTYKQDPKAKAETIQRFVTAALDASRGSHDGVDRTRIIPVIKDRPWLEETRQALLSRGVKKAPESVFEDLNPDLIIVYAEDSPKNIRYLTPADLDEAKIERRDLRRLACENLVRLLPKIEYHGKDGLYMVTAGGDYEASLLLVDSIWTSGQMRVQGEIVVAIPTRDLLLVTGSKDAQGIARVQQIIKEASSGGSYRLTPKLFVYRDGRFAAYSGDAEADQAIQNQPIR